MAVWTINGDGSYASTPGYGPIAGWSCTGLAVGPDDLTRVLWVHNGDHVFSMWTLHTDGSIASTPAIVPSAGYVPVSLAMDGYGVGRVLMSDSQGDSQIEDLLPDNASSGVLMTLPVGHIAGTGLTAGYTGDGLRAWKQTDAGARTYSLYDGADPIAELDASGNIQAVNTFGAQGLVSRHTTATNASVFYTFDERGNVAQRLDSTGPALSADLYDAFGARTGTAAPSDPWGFGAQWGYQSDAETGLVLCTNRYYDPQQGRFLTRDPIGYDGGVNLYAYTTNNPVNRIDPYGFLGKGVKPGPPGGAMPPGGPYYPGVPAHPSGVNIYTNVGNAYAHKDWPAALKNAWLYGLVFPTMEWDYKQDGKGLPYVKRHYSDMTVRENIYDAFGNFNFGAAAAAAGIDEDFALREADRNHNQTAGSKAKSFDHGDWWIRAGYNWYHDQQKKGRCK